METEQPALFEVNNVKMCTPRALADSAGIPIQTVYSAANSGRIICHRFGGRMYLDAASANTYATLYKALKGN